MSINVKKGQRVICKLSVPSISGKSHNFFSNNREYIGTGDNFVMDNFMANHDCSNTPWFNRHFNVIPFTPVIQKKKYHLSYEFLGVKHSTPYNTIFEFAQALDKVMDLAEVPQSTIDFKTETI